MADDKRIRVTADTTPLDEMRQAARQLWDDLNAMEMNFKQINDNVTQGIRTQIDLLKERNALYVQFNPNGQTNGRAPYQPSNIDNLDPNTGRTVPTRPSGQTTPGSESRNLDPTVFENQLVTLDRILDAVGRIAETLEQEQRNQSNGILPGGGGGAAPVPQPAPTPGSPVPPQAPGGKGGGLFGGKGIPTSLQGLMSLLPYGAALFAVGQMFGQQAQYETMQYGAQNAFQRQNNEGKHWLLNMATFGMSGAEADKQEIGRMAAQRNDRVLREYSALFNTSYEESLKRQMRGGFSDNYDALINNMSGRKTESNSDMIWNPETNKFDYVYTGAKDAKQAANAESGITPEEFQNWASRVLGLNLTEFAEKIVGLSRSGAKGSNTTEEDLRQLLLAQRIRGLSDSQEEDVLRTTRFRRGESGLTGAGVIQAFDTNLQKRFEGRADAEQLISSTLPEYLDQFNRIGERILDRVGSINTTNVVRSMTSIQNATGMEGRQLDRVQNALMGVSMSQDDVTQALLLRTARQIDDANGGKGNLSDLQAMIEDMPNDPKLQEQFFEQIRKMTGGGEQMRHVLKAIFPQLQMSDIIDADLGKKTGAELFRRGRTQGGQYYEGNVESKVGAQERSTAGTTNRQMVDGYARVMGGMEQLKSILESIEKPIPVMIYGDEADKIMEQLKGFSDMLRDAPTAFRRILQTWMDATE